MVKLTRIYTRTGDEGTTGLSDFSRTKKTDSRVVAVGDVDETNAAVGIALSSGALDDDVRAVLLRIQNELFDVGADLSTPIKADDPRPSPRITDEYVLGLEADCDAFNSRLRPLTSFVLPGGTQGAALLHLARAVARRAERSSWAAIGEHSGMMSPTPVKYLNRLSDLLFILARTANRQCGDILWQPGLSRPGSGAEQES